MLDKCIELKQALILFFDEFNVEDPITKQEWDTACKILKVLKPLYDVTNEMSGDKHVSVSKVIPLVDILRQTYPVHEDYDDDVATLAEQFSHEIGKSIEARFVTKVEDNPTYAKATILDPRFKTVGFFGGPLKIKVAKQLVKQEAQEMFPNEEAENNDAENDDSELVFKVGRFFST